MHRVYTHHNTLCISSKKSIGVLRNIITYTTDGSHVALHSPFLGVISKGH